jgi:RNA polymerase sigma-70 factor (ECF subfamily)
VREVRSTRDGDFEAVYRTFLGDVRKYATAHVGRDHADDVVSATFTTVWQRFDELPRTSTRSWVLGVARNHCRNRWRSDRRFSNLVDELIAARPKVESRLAEAGVSTEVLSMLAGVIPDLSAKDRELLVLIGWMDLTPAEAAEVLGASAGAVRVRWHRLRNVVGARLAIAMGDDGEQDGVA